MANVYKILQHSKRKEIDKQIVAGVADHKIAIDYGLSASCVGRYRRDYLPSLVKAAQLETVDGLIDRINEYLDRTDRLYQSVSEWMSDPDDPAKFSGCPRSSEVMVIYDDEETNAKGERRMVRRKAKLCDLLDKTCVDVISVNLMLADPRHTMLKTAEVLNKQLELLAKARGMITTSTTVNVVSGTLEDVLNIARKALMPWPDAISALAAALVPSDMENEDEA